MFSVTALSGGKRLLTYYDVTELKLRDAEIESANARTAETFANLRTMVDRCRSASSSSMPTCAPKSSTAPSTISGRSTPRRAEVGCSFRDLMDASRDVDPYGSDEAAWQRHIAEREAEIRAGVAGSRQLPRNDGRTLICSMAPLAGGKRLISYVDVTDMKDREAELADALEKARLAEAVINAVKDPIFVKDDNLRFVFVNEAFAALFGQTPQADARQARRRFPLAERCRAFRAERTGGACQRARLTKWKKISRSTASAARASSGRTASAWPAAATMSPASCSTFPT